MRYSRTGIVAVLLAAEVFIGGAILWAVSGGRMTARAQGMDVNRMSEQARLDAGASPHVLIDDPDTRVVVTASTDGKVHVTDHAHRMGWSLGPPADARLSVERTSDGVAIRRASTPGSVSFFGFDFQRTEVAVPPNSSLDIPHCGGASISGVQAADVKIACAGGSLHFDDVQSPAIDAVTNDGSIRANKLRVGGGRLQSADGSIRLALAGANLTVHAQTADGSIRMNGARIAGDGDSGATTYQFGTGGGSLQVSTQDGSIHITSNGAP